MTWAGRQERSSLLGILLLSLFAFVLTVYAWWPMLAAYPHTEIGDGQLCFHYVEAARVSVARYHELPLWDPYQCDGLPLWDNPTAFIASPLVWPALLVGATITIELWILVHVAAGFVSMWLLARRELDLGPAGAFVASGAWAYSGFHQHHYSGGHLPMVGFLWFPLAILLWRRAETDSRCRLGLAALLALMFYEGAVYPLPHLVAVLAAETMTRMWPLRRIPRLLLAGIVTGGLAIALAASRLLPVLDQLRSHTRAMQADVDAMHWNTLVDMFLARSHGRAVEGQQYVWTEFATYLGPIVLALSLVGIMVASRKRLWMLAPLVFTFLLMLGHFSPYAPWHLLHAHVPPFKEMRVPSRFRASVCLFLAAYAGVAVHRIASWLRGRKLLGRYSKAAEALLVAIACVGVGDIITVGTFVIPPFFGGPPATARESSPMFFYGGADLAPFIDQPAQNRGRFDCYDEWGFGSGAPLWAGDVPQVRASDDAAIVVASSRTQNSFSIDVDVTRPTQLLINTSYDRGWRTDVGTLSENDKQLQLGLVPGHHLVHLRYWPHGMTAGLVLTGLGLACIAAFCVMRRRAKASVRRPVPI